MTSGLGNLCGFVVEALALYPGRPPRNPGIWTKFHRAVNGIGDNYPVDPCSKEKNNIHSCNATIRFLSILDGDKRVILEVKATLVVGF